MNSYVHRIWIADYSVSIYNITNVYSVECHQAPVGSNGDLVAYLYGPQANPTSDPVSTES